MEELHDIVLSKIILHAVGPCTCPPLGSSSPLSGSPPPASAPGVTTAPPVPSTGEATTAPPVQYEGTVASFSSATLVLVAEGRAAGVDADALTFDITGAEIVVPEWEEAL